MVAPYQRLEPQGAKAVAIEISGEREAPPSESFDLTQWGAFSCPRQEAQFRSELFRSALPFHVISLVLLMAWAVLSLIAQSQSLLPGGAAASLLIVRVAVLLAALLMRVQLHTLRDWQTAQQFGARSAVALTVVNIVWEVSNVFATPGPQPGYLTAALWQHGRFSDLYTLGHLSAGAAVALLGLPLATQITLLGGYMAVDAGSWLHRLSAASAAHAAAPLATPADGGCGHECATAWLERLHASLVAWCVAEVLGFVCAHLHAQSRREAFAMHGRQRGTLEDRLAAQGRKAAEQLAMQEEAAAELLRTQKQGMAECLQAQATLGRYMYHNLRDDANSIMCTLEVLTDQILRGQLRLSRELEAMVGASRAHAGHMVQMVMNVRTLSALHLEAVEPVPKVVPQCPFSLRNSCESCMEVVRHLVRQRPIQLHVIIDQTFPDQWLGAGMQLIQILVNLLSNACRVTKQGNIVLRLAPVLFSPDDESAAAGERNEPMRSTYYEFDFAVEDSTPRAGERRGGG